MAYYDNPATNAYYNRKLAEELKWEANQAQRKGYYKVARELWDAYYAILEEAETEEAKAKNGEYQ